MINKDEVNLRLVEQIVDREQVASIGNILKLVDEKIANNKYTLSEAVDIVLENINKDGLLYLSFAKGGVGSLALPRKQEIMAAFSRFRKLKIN